MKELIRASAVANRVRMSSHDGMFVLVEGHEDSKLYSTFIDRERCKVVVAFGKPNVLGAIAELRVTEVRPAVAIIDADHSALAARGNF